MEIIVPVDVTYKGVTHKAYTSFFCDSPSFERLFKPLGAWAFCKEDEVSTTVEKVKLTNKKKGKHNA